MNLDILHADIYTTHDNQTLDTFIIQDDDGQPITDDGDIDTIRISLIRVLDSDDEPEIQITKRMPRILKSFSSPTGVQFTQDLFNHRTIMVITTVDRPGLLYSIAKVISDCGLQVRHAKIATLGERVKDIFYLTDKNHKAVRDDQLLEQLERELINKLDQPRAQ